MKHFFNWNSTNREMVMSTNNYDDFDPIVDDLNEAETVIIEASPSTKLERRRKIEDLFEEKRLKEELEDFG